MRKRIHKMKAKARRLGTRIKQKKRGRRKQTPNDLRAIIRRQKKDIKQMLRLLDSSMTCLKHLGQQYTNLQWAYNQDGSHPADGM